MSRESGAEIESLEVSHAKVGIGWTYWRAVCQFCVWCALLDRSFAGWRDGPRSLRRQARSDLLLENREEIRGGRSDPVRRRFEVPDLASSPKEVDRTVWQHWLRVVAPSKPKSNVAFLFITGGSNGDAPKRAELGVIATLTNSVVAELKMVPNEPLVFGNDGVKRKEDDLIAYTWDKFLKGGDENWPARLPMVKSAVRVNGLRPGTFVERSRGKDQGREVRRCRGIEARLTTWCTAAVDKRVAAIIPLSIDCLNNAPSMQHHVAVYGFYTEAVGDYFAHGITARHVTRG